MNHDKQKRVLNHIVSPYGLAIISYGFFLFCCLIPPSIYSHYMHEPDLMFLDPTIILFYTLCVGAFLAGLWSFEKLFPPLPVAEHKLELRVPPAVFLLLPLLFCTALTLLSNVLIVKNNPLLLPLLAMRQAYALEPDDGSVSGIQLEGTFNIAVLFLTGVIWWAAWRGRGCDFQGKARGVVHGALAVAILAVFASSSLMLSRHSSVVLVTGLVVIYLLARYFTGRLSWKLIVKTALIFVVGGALFFFMVDWLRRGSPAAGQTPAFIGYTIASYNRLAAVLQGKLRFDYVERGIYFSNFLSFNHLLNGVIPFGSTMRVPEFFDWWRASFASVGRAGLDFRMIFFGAFGEIYAEIGWFAPLYVFGYGLLYGLVWRWMRAGRVAGILLYPYFAYCILFWFSTNGLFDQDLVALVIDALLLGAFEFLCVSQGKLFVPASQVA